MSKDKENEEEQGSWKTARSIFGKLITIDRAKETISLEYKDTDTEEWITETFSAMNIKAEDYEKLRKLLGQDIEIHVTDDIIDSWYR